MFLPALLATDTSYRHLQMKIEMIFYLELNRIPAARWNVETMRNSWNDLVTNKYRADNNAESAA